MENQGSGQQGKALTEQALCVTKHKFNYGLLQTDLIYFGPIFFIFQDLFPAYPAAFAV